MNLKCRLKMIYLNDNIFTVAKAKEKIHGLTILTNSMKENKL